MLHASESAVAEALANLPAIEGEFAAGRLSYAKVRALVRIADEKTDRDWAKKARGLTADELEVIAARCRKGTRPARRLLTAVLNETTSRMIVDLPSEEMEMVTQALDRVRKEAGAALSASEALVFLCADSLAGELGQVKTADRVTVIVHVGEDGKSWAETASGPAPLKPEVMERLLCDCTLRIAREDKQGVMGISRAQRTVSELTRRAIEVRDGRRCRVPGCKRKLWLDCHHGVWQIRGGRHDLANLFLLCAWHHRQHHDGMLLIRKGEKRGEWIFEAAAGWVLGDDGELRREVAGRRAPGFDPVERDRSLRGRASRYAVGRSEVHLRVAVGVDGAGAEGEVRGRNDSPESCRERQVARTIPRNRPGHMRHAPRVQLPPDDSGES